MKSNDVNLTVHASIQEEIISIWRDVLKIDQINVNDHFLDMGGDSLIATQIISRLNETFCVDLPISIIFDRPTIAALEQFIKSISKTKYLPIPSKQRAKESILSFAQERLWFIDQLESGSPFYNIAKAYRLKGIIDADAIEKSVCSLIARHESFRTSFHFSDGHPVQRITADQKFKTTIIDVKNFLPESQKDAIDRIIQEEAARVFDLSQSPLFSVALLKIKDTEYILVLNMHHIISDGWSMGIILKELASCYHAFAHGQPPELPPLQIQYADFAIWQKEWLKGQRLEKQLLYWKKQLEDVPPLLNLPADRSRPAVITYQGGRHAFSLSEALTRELKALSRRQGATLFMTLLTGFKILLYRYSGQEDIIVATPIANRNRKEIETQIGFFVNTLVLRTSLSSSPNFIELLERIKKTALDAYDHQDLPFEKLIEEFHPERNLSYTPLVQVMFALQNTPGDVFQLSDLNLEEIPVDIKYAKFDLFMSITDKNESLNVIIEFNNDIFDISTIKRLAGHYERLLQGIVENPKQTISLLPMLTEAERHQILNHWNDTASDYPRDKSIPQIFEEQVEKTPDAVAVVLKNQEMTYKDLDERSNRVARYLISCGIGSGHMIGICIERSIEMITGIIGIIKAGGAYIPIDPDYPEARLEFMIKDSGVKLMLAQKKNQDKLSAYGGQILFLDSIEALMHDETNNNICPKSNPTNLAYVMYTSGSTGKPKGVCVNHRGIIRLVKNSNYLKMTDKEVFLQMAPVSFDASTFEIWGCLLNGGRLVIMPPGIPSLDELGDAIRHYGITTLWLTSGMLHLMIEQRPEDLKPLRQLIAGGDVLSVHHIKTLVEKFKNIRLVNGYGPTENTTFSCCYPITNSQWSCASIPIGRPISNTQVYILSRHLQPVPVGLAGELYVGGDGIASGYLNRPQLTEEKFIPNPFGKEPGARLYKTGDMARYMPDGNIEFLGRFDHQVKIRGFRIEPGEIVTLLKDFPGVKEAVVIAREASPGNKSLAAYLVCDDQLNLTVRQLQEYLKKKLPGYMIPAFFVFLDQMPLLPNGKIDRQSLPVPDISQPNRSYIIIPRNDLERRLVGIWEEVLMTRPIGIRDNFFEIGGHSLLAVRLFARMESVFKKRLPIATLFRSPTIEQLACVLRQQNFSETPSRLVAIQPEGSRPPFFCVHDIADSVFIFRRLAQYIGLDQPFYGIRGRGAEGLEEPADRLEAIAASYIRDILQLQPEGPYYLGGYSSGGIIAFEMAQQLLAAGHKISLLAIIDSVAPHSKKYRTKSQIAFVFNRLTNTACWLKMFAGCDRQYQMEKVRIIKMRFRRFVNEKNSRNSIHCLLDEMDFLRNSEQLYQFAKAYYNALKHYQPERYEGRIRLIKSRPGTFFFPGDPEMGWGALAVKGVEVDIVPGFHAGPYSIYEEPYVSVLAEKLKQSLITTQNSI